jgi:dethiobiotin synthetase
VADLKIFVAGSTTEVGKTWVSVRLLETLRSSGPVAARKPVQSFDETDTTTDADLLAAGSGEDPHSVCPPHRRYERPLAPPVAAQLLGRPPWTIADLVAEVGHVDGTLVVEGVGGPLSPLANDGDSVDLARALDVDLVVIVVPAGLGAINAALTSVRCFHGFDVVVFLNRFDSDEIGHTTNRSWLVEREGIEVFVTVPDLARAVEARRTTLSPEQSTVEVP